MKKMNHLTLEELKKLPKLKGYQPGVPHVTYKAGGFTKKIQKKST